MLVILIFTALAPFLVLARKHHRTPHTYSLSETPRLPISKQIGKSNPIHGDRNRVNNHIKVGQQYHSSTSVAVPELALNNNGTDFLAEVGIGDPPTYYRLIVDTGSANTWVGANKPFVETATSVKTSNLENVTYGSAVFEGYLYKDTVTIAPGITINQQPIGVAYKATNISPRDGILGIGPKKLTAGTIYPDNTIVIPTVTDNLFDQGTIKQNLVAISFEPQVLGPVQNGELTFGSTDPSKYTGDIEYFPLTNTGLSSEYWGVNASFRYGAAGGSASFNILSTGAGIVDTGTTLVHLSSAAYKRYVDATGATYNETMQYLYITQAQYEGLQSLFFVVGDSTFELIPNAQIWPRSLNSVIGGQMDIIYLVVQDIGEQDPGIDFIAGMTLLERVYSVFDTENQRLGLATTPYTYAETN